MIKWREAYERLKGLREFASYYGKGGAVPTMGSFRFLAYSQLFTGVAAAATPGTFGAPSGPTLMNFPSGAIILGITAAAYQAQTTTGSFLYSPSFCCGKRDLFGLSFQYTNDEQITPNASNGNCLASALLGDGAETIFPGKEIVIPPSQGILCAVSSLAPSPTLTVEVVYHAMVPRSVG